MVNLKELEIKILDIDIQEIEKKLTKIGAKFVERSLQKILTYDFYDSITRFDSILNEIDLKATHVSINRLRNLFNEINPCLSENEQNIIKEITSYTTLKEFGDSIEDINKTKPLLYLEKFRNIIKESQNSFQKWIRLRETNKEITITIKQIYSTESEYNLNDVKEVEIKVDSFDMANLLLNELGYGNSRYQQKKRISYKLDNISIEIDSWPHIPPYLEIEATEKEIYEMVEKLGYSENDIKIMNTSDVYSLYGLNIYDYIELKFNE